MPVMGISASPSHPDVAGDLGLAAARWVWLAALLSCGGALLFRALEPQTAGAAQTRLIRASLAVAGLAWLVWAAAQCAALAGANPAAWRSVMLHTDFGRAALLQLALLAACRAALSAPPWVAAPLALAAVAAQVAHLHGWAMETSPGRLTLAELAHVLAAAAWLGSLLPLRLGVREAAAAQNVALLRRYSRRATLFVLLLAGSAIVQGDVLLGGLPGIAGTPYGWVSVVKLALFAVLLGFAVRHRWRLPRRLSGTNPDAARRSLLRSLAWEALAGVAVIAAAALLSRLTPGMHAQPEWPFAWQPSLSAAQEDADIAHKSLLAGGGLALACLLILHAALRRRARWAALAAAIVLVSAAAPHLSPLFVPATATTFYRSPTGFAAAGIAEGATLYAGHCARCHAAAVPPAGPAMTQLRNHTDGALFGLLQHGITAADGTSAMPGFAALLTADERWQLIDFLRARNAGQRSATPGFWPQALRAPDLDADCADGSSISLASVRGRPVRLVFQSGAPLLPDSSVPPNPAVLTVLVLRPGAHEGTGGDCIASDPSVTAAYAVVTGLSPGELAGAEIQIGEDGTLRGLRRPPQPAASLALPAVN